MRVRAASRQRFHASRSNRKTVSDRNSRCNWSLEPSVPSAWNSSKNCSNNFGRSALSSFPQAWMPESGSSKSPMKIWGLRKLSQLVWRAKRTEAKRARRASKLNFPKRKGPPGNTMSSNKGILELTPISPGFTRNCGAEYAQNLLRWQGQFQLFFGRHNRSDAWSSASRFLGSSRHATTLSEAIALISFTTDSRSSAAVRVAPFNNQSVRLVSVSL